MSQELQYPLVSVVILNYNGKHRLGQILHDCLSSALGTAYPSFEVIFVDNASTDGSVEFVRENFGQNERLRIIENDANLGFAEGNNVGIRKARGEYVALLNSDAVVDPMWLKELAEAVQPAGVGAAQSKLLLMSNPNLMDCAGGFIDQYGYHHYEVGCGEKAEKYNRAYEIFYAKGAGMILKREALKCSGLFDPRIFMYYDETDLCWRLRLCGYKVVFVPTSLVYHAAGETASGLQAEKRLYFSTRNHFFVLLKNFGDKNMVRALSISLVWELRNIGKFVLKREPALASATVKALLWNLGNFGYIWRQRQVTQKLVRRVPDENLKKVMLKPFPPFPLSLVFSRSHYLPGEA